MENDRRDYFRVNDTAYLRATPFDADKPAIEDYFPDLHQIAVLKEFERVNSEYHELLDRVKDAAVRKLMGLFNEKLELMTRYLHITDIKDLKLEAQRIDIGEGGCSGAIEGEFKQGDVLALAIIFTPSYVSLFCRARVVTTQSESSDNRLHLEFQQLAEYQRQTLTRHMFKVQAQSRIQ